MSPASGTVPESAGRRTVAALGAAYIVFAAGWASVRATGGEPSLNVLIVTTLIVGPGVILLYGAYRLPEYDITPDYYPVISQWCLGAVVVMLAILSLYHFQPADSFRNPHRSFLMFTALSSVAGLGVGLYDARARTRARELDHRNRELERVQALLEESNDRLEQFASAASHDLQEPLRMITRYLTLVEHRYADALDEDGREFVAFAIDGATRLQEMSDGLLEYSRVEADSYSFHRINLDDVLEDALANLHVRIEESDAEVTRDPLPFVDGDRRQLRQVFQNLVSNAITYCGDEPPRVYISADQRGREWVISVRDWGIGIDPDDQDRIFDVFHRLHSRDEHPGTGIGLSLCQRIVEYHGGQIWVDSEPGVGSTFSFSLPAVDA